MDRSRMRLPRGFAPDPLERAIAEIDGAIALVLDGTARTVQLCCLPGAERAAGVGAAHAHVAGVGFHVERDPGAGVTVVVGPRDDA